MSVQISEEKQKKTASRWVQMREDALFLLLLWLYDDFSFACIPRYYDVLASRYSRRSTLYYRCLLG